MQCWTVFRAWRELRRKHWNSCGTVCWESCSLPQSIIEEQESRRELYDGLKRLTQREQTYLLYRYGFTDGEEHPLIGTAIYFHLTKGRAKKTEEQAMDNLWLELPWWFI